MKRQERVEYGQLMTDGGVHVWPHHADLLRIFPLAKRIEAGQMHGGRVLRRRVIVVTEWAPLPDGAES